MALVLNATVGGASSNSYGTVLEADAYFEGRPGSEAWFDFTVPQKEQYLVGGTTLIDRYTYDGYRVTSVQRLLHPRSGLWFDGYFFPYDAIARPVKEATFEWALALGEAQSAPDLSILSNFEKLQVGSIGITPAKGGGPDPEAPPDAVLRLLGGFWGLGLSGQSELVRG